MTPDTDWAFAQYERVRDVLPSADFPKTSQTIVNLGDIADQIDVFLLDAFGVLNVGERVIPTAPAQVAALQSAGKQVFVLTNGAGAPTEKSVEKYRKLGYDFDDYHVISSRAALLAGLAHRSEANWGGMAASFSRLETFPNSCRPLLDDIAVYDNVDAFALISAQDWTETRQALLIESLKKTPRPVLVGNPDIIAPQEGEFSLEPGWFAHEIARATGIQPEFYGKPFKNVFDIALSRVDPSIPRERIAMVGDTLHTDVLGGAAEGLKTVLITDHGLFAGHDVSGYINKSGIVPNWIAKDT